MIKLFRKTRELMFSELALARSQNGKHFHSTHEAYGVIVEEKTEAWDECIDVDHAVDKLLGAIRRNDKADVHLAAKDIERHALLAACEYIQVAAMARKLRDSERAM